MSEGSAGASPRIAASSRAASGAMVARPMRSIGSLPSTSTVSTGTGVKPPPLVAIASVPAYQRGLARVSR